MNDKDELDRVLRDIRRFSGTAELTHQLYRIDYEPARVRLRSCTYCGEVFLVSVYLSWLLRISQQELREFARSYLS